MTNETEHLIECDAEVFAQNFNLHPHEVTHRLAGHLLFEIPALAELAQQMSARKNPRYATGDVYFHQGMPDPNAEVDACDPATREIADLIRDIERGQTWVILKHIERESAIARCSSDVCSTCWS